MPEQDPPPIEPGTGRLSYNKQRRTIVSSNPSPRPGTLTVTIGDRRVTLDPLDPREKFNADKAVIEQMLITLDMTNYRSK